MDSVLFSRRSDVDPQRALLDRVSFGDIFALQGLLRLKLAVLWALRGRDDVLGKGPVCIIKRPITCRYREVASGFERSS